MGGSGVGGGGGGGGGLRGAGRPRVSGNVLRVLHSSHLLRVALRDRVGGGAGEGWGGEEGGAGGVGGGGGRLDGGGGEVGAGGGGGGSGGGHGGGAVSQLPRPCGVLLGVCCGLGGRGLPSFTLELKLSNSRTHS
jgi:hypothetical protein